MHSEIDAFRLAANDLVELLEMEGEQEWAETIGRLTATVISAADPIDRRGAVANILHVFGGMGGSSDLVLQADSVPSATNDELVRLRENLYSAAVGLISNSHDRGLWP